MQGTIASYSFKDKVGRIQGLDGNIYTFYQSSFLNPNEEQVVQEGMECDFDIKENLVANLRLRDIKAFQYKNQTFKEPAALQLVTGDLPSEFTLIDKAKTAISSTDRVKVGALYNLKHDCVRLGANIILDGIISSKTKNAMGYGFEFYTVEGVPTVVGITDPEGELSRDDLLRRLHHKEILKLKNNQENVKTAKLALKISGLILLIIFFAGFLYTV